MWCNLIMFLLRSEKENERIKKFKIKSLAILLRFILTCPQNEMLARSFISNVIII